MKTVAIVLSAGSGKRMGGEIKKQYMLLESKPILYYCLKTFEDSFIDEIILVTSKEDIEFVRERIVDEYSFKKVSQIVPGGRERYHSVLNGLRAVDDSGEKTYIFVHDGARPFVDEATLERALDSVSTSGACVVGMPSKDTVKIATPDGVVADTPNRSLVWNVQTPQVFEFGLIKEAYEAVAAREEELRLAGTNITDDAMVLEQYCDHPIHLVEGSYRNIKITTPEDLVLGETFLKA